MCSKEVNPPEFTSETSYYCRFAKMESLTSKKNKKNRVSLGAVTAKHMSEKNRQNESSRVH